MIDFKTYIKELQSIPIDENLFKVQALSPRLKFPLSDFAIKNCWLDISKSVSIGRARIILNEQRYGNIRNNHSTWSEFRISYLKD